MVLRHHLLFLLFVLSGLRGVIVWRRQIAHPCQARTRSAVARPGGSSRIFRTAHWIAVLIGNGNEPASGFVAGSRRQIGRDPRGHHRNRIGVLGKRIGIGLRPRLGWLLLRGALPARCRLALASARRAALILPLRREPGAAATMQARANAIPIPHFTAVPLDCSARFDR
jgi:hypothetical protein